MLRTKLLKNKKFIRRKNLKIRKFEKTFLNNYERLIELALLLVTVIISLFSLRSSNKALEATASSLEESKKQFIQSNKSFLQVTIVKKDIYSTDSTIDNISGFEIKNLGNYPARILYSGWTIINRYNEDIGTLSNYYSLQNVYITKESPLFIEKKQMLGKIHIINRQPFVFSGFIQYEDIISKQIRDYSYSIDLDHATIGYLVNTTDDLDSSYVPTDSTITFNLPTVRIKPYIPKIDTTKN